MGYFSSQFNGLTEMHPKYYKNLELSFEFVLCGDTNYTFAMFYFECIRRIICAWLLFDPDKSLQKNSIIAINNLLINCIKFQPKRVYRDIPVLHTGLTMREVIDIKNRLVSLKIPEEVHIHVVNTLINYSDTPPKARKGFEWEKYLDKSYIDIVKNAQLRVTDNIRQYRNYLIERLEISNKILPTLARMLDEHNDETIDEKMFISILYSLNARVHEKEITFTEANNIIEKLVYTFGYLNHDTIRSFSKLYHKNTPITTVKKAKRGRKGRLKFVKLSKNEGQTLQHIIQDCFRPVD